MKRKQYPSQKELNNIFKYDHETGKLYNKIYRNSRSIAGQEVGCLTKMGYLQVSVKNKQYFVHNLIWIMIYGDLPNKMIDHKNRNKSDNTLKNLRIADDYENQYNRPPPKDNTSGYKGVYIHTTSKRWYSQIGYKGKRKHLGYFNSKEEAYNAYCKAAKELHGEFARI